MRDRRQTHKIRSEYGATTALMLMVALLLLMLTGMVANEVQRTGGGASARVIATDDVATEGGLRAVTGLGSTSYTDSRLDAGSGAGGLLAGMSYVRRASDGDADAQTNVPEEIVDAEDSSTPTSGDDQDAAGQADESDTPSSDAQNPADAAQDADQPTDSEQPSQPSDDTQSSQGQTDSSADSDSQESQPTGDDTPQQPGEKTLEKKLTCVNGTSYTVTLTYDATANIPDNAQLKLVELNRSLTKKEKKDKANKDRPFDTERFVSASALDKRGEVLDRSLKLTDSDYRYFTKYLDILLVADGKTVTPVAPVDVTIQTKAISQDKAGTLELALMVDVDKPTKKDPYAYKPLGGKNETEEKESTTKVSFTTDELGEFALAGVAYSMGSWDVDGMTVNVMGPRDLKSSSMPDVSVEIDEEGLELRDAFNVKVKPAPKYGTTLWISATPSGKAQDSGKVGGLYGYRVWKGMLADRLFDPAGTKKPVEFASDDEGIALVWDGGYRQQSLTMRKVTVKGMMPKDVSGSVTYVNGRYDDLASVSKKLVKAAEAKGAQLKAVAAYDINLTADGSEYRPTTDKPVTVSIASIYIQEGGTYDVWRVQDNGTVSVVEDATQDGDTMTFQATSLDDSYVVVETTVHTTLEASNGQQYRVTVTYDNKSGIPENATLAVKELNAARREAYLEQAAQALDAEIESVHVDRAFDIRLIKDDVEYHSTNGEVQVSIQLFDTEVTEEMQVVHMGEETQVMNAQVQGDILSFATDGFSVYLIVEAKEPYVPKTGDVQDLAELSENYNNTYGFYLSYGSGNYFTNTLNNNNAFIETTGKTAASKWYFEKASADNTYYIYTYVDGAKKYMYNTSGNSMGLTDNSGGATGFILSEALPAKSKFYFKVQNQDKWLQHSGSGNGIRLFTDNKNSTNSQIIITYTDPEDPPADYYELNGKTYSIARLNSDNAGIGLGYDLSAQALQYYSDASGNYWINRNSAIADWSFTNVNAANYTISTQVDGATRYLALNGENLTLSDIPCKFKADSDNADHYSFSVEGYYLCADAATGFGSTNSNDDNRWLNLVQKTDNLKETDMNDFVDSVSYKINGSEDEHSLPGDIFVQGNDALNVTLRFFKSDGAFDLDVSDGNVLSYTLPAGITVSETYSATAMADISGNTYGIGTVTNNAGALTLTCQNMPSQLQENTDLSIVLEVPVTIDAGAKTIDFGNGEILTVRTPHNPMITPNIVGNYNSATETVTYTVVVTADGDIDNDEQEYPVVIADSTTGDSPALQFVSGSYTYAHREGFAPGEGKPATQVNGVDVTETETPFTSFPITVEHMYDGDTITLTYTAEVLRGIYIGAGQAAAQNTVTITNDDSFGNPNPSNITEDDTASVTTEGMLYTPLTREYVTLDGSWAYWRVTVNPAGYALNEGEAYTLSDTFDDGIETDKRQSIDYSSVAVSANSVIYDYSAKTGTFVIPDNTPVTITYRTRIAAQPGEAALFRGTARLLDTDGNEIASATAGVTAEPVVIYPSPSEVGGLGDNYMVKLFVYAEGQMQQGIEGARFILLDANQRPLEYKVGDNQGEPVTFTTGSNGYVNIELHEEAGDVSIEKNTAYYLEMIQAVDGYQKDNTLYSFMITDDPDYNSGGFYTYYNGDTMKVRLYPASAGLSVSIRFSGSYALREDQQNDVMAVLQKLDESNEWVEVERHPYTDTQWGTIEFDEPLYDAELGVFQRFYRVVVENENPWDLPENINVVTNYYCLVGTASSDPHTEPQEFSVDSADESVNVVIDNRYEDPQLTIVKMDKSTGEVLPGTEFSVYRIVNGAQSGEAVTTYTTDSNGELVVRGGDAFESETLYGIKETKAIDGYLMPQTDEWHYFYFCNDAYLEPSILANLPEGETVINLTESGDKITVANQKEEITIPVMKLWQGNSWPGDAEILVGLYRSVEDGDAQPVLNDDGTPRTVTLTRERPYNNTAFKDLPSRDAQDRNYTYSIREEEISGHQPLEAGYNQEYGVSSAGVYIVRNKPATSLTVAKKWYDSDGNEVRDGAQLAAQSPVTFDVYRSTERFADADPEDGITNADMSTFAANLVRVRENLSFGAEDGWSMTIPDLDRQDNLGNLYCYYILETVPSFGNELYEVDEGAGIVTVKNKVAPQTVNLTVTKAALKDDPRLESLDRDFEFTLKLNNDRYPIRSWQVYTDPENGENSLTTDWNGEVSFKLKPTNPEQQQTQGASITLSLPAGVTATVTEAYNPEYTVATGATVEGGTADDGRTFSYETSSDNGSVTLTYTNTLRVVCKVVKADESLPEEEKQIPFETLNRALEYIRSNPDDFTSPWVIYMLEDYTIPVTDGIDLQAGESLTLTTASTADSLFPFNPPANDTERTFAVITRGGAGESMLKNAGALMLENICLDGGSIEADGDGGLVHSTGTLELKAGTTLRNSAAGGRGGAVYAEGTVSVADGVAITGNSAPSASALYLSGTLNMTGGSVTGNTGASDGAVVITSFTDVVNLAGNPVIFGNTNNQDKAANLYIGVASDSILNVRVPGLGVNAQIGITAMNGHNLIGEQFATAEFGQTNNLNRFVNDAYGYRGKLKDGTSTNIVWNGLKVKIKKEVEPTGANANDRFSLTLTSPSIVLNTYTIDGTLDYTVTAAYQNRPGRIVLRNVKAEDEIDISPLPVGEYAITEADSNYAPTYALVETGSGETPTPIEEGVFTADNDCTVLVTNTRKLADVVLTKTLDDRLKAEDEEQEFEFTVTLIEADGTPVSDFTLGEGATADASGEATFTMSPTNTVAAISEFVAPVGATMTITETDDPKYEITASAVTMPEGGGGAAIEDEDTDNDNVFAFTVADDGANVTYANERKMAEIELRKNLANKVSATESFTFTATLTRAAGDPAANYIMYRDAANPGNNIVTDSDGKATITFDFGPQESTEAVELTIPEGTTLEVAETNLNGHPDFYNTTHSVNGGAAVLGAVATIEPVTDDDRSIEFTNTRKTNTVVVKNEVKGYAGNDAPFTYTATVTDGGEGQDDYNVYGFKNGSMTFELAKDQIQTLIVPYGASLTVTEAFIVGYSTTVKRGGAGAVEKMSDTFPVTTDLTSSSPLLFTNSQLIGLRLVNNTSSTLENVKVEVEKNNIYLVNSDQTGQTRISTDKTATLDVADGEEVILEIQHDTSATAEQKYTVSGVAPTVGYYYTINNEPSFHEYADPAIMRIYDATGYEVKGKLRYSVKDSIVTFTEQPLVSFDVNGGTWTTEMEGYRDRDGDRQVYQAAVDSGTVVAEPIPAPVYPTAEGIGFLGWTEDKAFAKADHAAGEDISESVYDFNTPVTAPITLYAVWAKPPRDNRVVTLTNGFANNLTVTATLTQNGTPVSGHTFLDGSTTDADGKAVVVLQAGQNSNLNVPDGATLVLSVQNSALIRSAEFTDAGTSNNSFTITSVNRDGTVTFTPGICKITDGSGNVLYESSGEPAVYRTLAGAFTAYVGNLYTDASHTTAATPAAVKLLVDEYFIEEATPIALPNATMTLTTAGKTDGDFPYVGSRDRATIYRTEARANTKCFTQSSSDSNVTLTNLVLDGGSENGVEIAKEANGGLFHINGGTLTVEVGITMRNCEYADYTDGDNSRGGAINIKNGTLNVSAGLFTNLHARNGGAIFADNSAVLNLSGANGSTRFENCDAACSGGAVYYNASSNLTIDGGNDNGFKVDAEGKTQFDSNNEKIEVNNPGIVFNACVAKDSSLGDGGAIYINSSGIAIIHGCDFVECSAKVDIYDNRQHGGGGIAAININTLTVSNCTFSVCDTLTNGGAVFARIKDKTWIKVDNCIFRNDSCRGQGGAVSVYQYTEGENSSAALTINGSKFENCSSGTSNGSGGAIQSYLPVMSLIDSDFTDCWAGKEGGAINHFYSTSFDTIWNQSSLTVTGCEFTRCRAEDRYQPTYAQHYAGGINTKAYTVTITDSKFTDCVSTLRDGGALHIGGRNTGSTATILRSTFKNCLAKTSGGAVMASTETLTVSDSYFYGCQAFGKPESNYAYNNGDKKNQNGGGAISHSESSRNTSTQAMTTITNCVFSADPEGGEGALSCSTATDGGAIWTRATAVTISGCTIDGSAANGSGGGIYLSNYKNSSQTATISGTTVNGKVVGSIKNCQARDGSAVYVGYGATFSGDLVVSGNTVSDVDDGAIHGGALYFEDNVKVENNTCSADSTYNHDVLMQMDGVYIINTTAKGLGPEAHIGVYVPDSISQNRALEGQAFGTYDNSTVAGSNYLDAFFNNRDSELYGCQLASNDTRIYWGIFICKITDADGNLLKRANGRDAIYQKLSMAIDEFTSVTDDNDETGKAKYIKMLVENYDLRQTDAIANFPAADITLTTALCSDATRPYRGTDGTVCTISRANSDNELFKLETPSAVFRLENITLDGRRDKSTTTGDYRLITATDGNLFINPGTTLQYGFAGNGGAIYATGAPVTVNLDTNATAACVRFLNCVATANGGAISADSLTIRNGEDEEKGTLFENCSAASGGAVCINGSTMSITGAQFQNCNSTGEGGAVYHSKDDAEVSGAISTSAFTSCSAGASGGAVSSKAGGLTVELSVFDNCQAAQNGGAIHHLGTGSTTITDTAFTGCKTTGTETELGFGGSVYTEAGSVVLTDDTFQNSTSTNHGGALYCQSSAVGSAATISGATFENCSTSRATDGSGGAIYSRNTALTLQKSEMAETCVTACAATGFSGAVHMEMTGSTLNIKDGTLVSGCYANQGGAIYLKNGVTLNLTDSPEFTQNGYTTQRGSIVEVEKGACVYLEEGGRINLADSPKFSRNILPNTSRITNGGVLDYVRQDIYMAGYASATDFDKNAASIYVVGELTGDTIWVWPEQSPHKLANEQFAKIADGVEVSADCLSHLRNALSDEVTHCTNGEYLAGVQVGTDTANIYWDKMYTVSFRKMDNKGVTVPKAGFTLYRSYAGGICSDPVATAVSADGENDKDTSGNIRAAGLVEFTSVRIGAYYMKETQVPVSFKENEAIYLVLVGTPCLSYHDDNKSLWEGDGPLNVADAATLIARHTTDAGKYYGIFQLGSDGKADLSKNLASGSVGIINIRRGFDAWFMKTDAEGNPLPNATFTLYEDANESRVLNEYSYPVMKRWHRDGEDYPEPTTSADGTKTYRKADGSTVEKGVVYFRELPIGSYYLVETAYPVRNGNNRLTYFVEGDRVFQLVITGVDSDNDGAGDFTLSEWNAEAGEFVPCDVVSDNYVVHNQEAVCKLTDDNGTLLYELGKLSLDGKESYHPAIYPTLEEGFDAAQAHGLYSGAVDKQMISNDSQTLLKLQVLKDFALTEPVTYSGLRGLTFTTASRTATSAIDRYVFTTTRTTDTSRAEVKRAYNAYASADPNDVALITVNGGASLTLQNINLNGQKNTYDGRAIHVTNGRLALLDNAQVHNFKQSDPMGEGTARGGAILMDDGTALSIDGGTRSHSAVISDNQVAGDGGAIAIGEGCVVDIRNAQLLGNKATDGNGGALYVASGVNVPLTQGTLRGNEAALGSAIYLADGDGTRPTLLTMNSGSMTGNKASASDGGAINVGGADAIIAFEGSPTVFNNVSTSNSTQQRNVVLGDDTNDIIRTTGTGLTGGLIGVYVTGEISEDQFQKHGLASKPFGTFGADRNLQVFRNDRNLALYGTKNDEGTIDWIHVVCKLTDANDNLLYQETVFTINGSTVRCKAPAIYPTIQEGLDAVAGGLYSHGGAAFGNTSNLKLKMLQDVELETGVQYAANNRATTFTTAEAQVSAGMSANDDYFVFQTTRQENDEPATTALVSRGYDGTSLITATGKSLMLTDIVLDGAKEEDWQANGHGGLVRLSSGQLVIASGATLQNSRTNGNGGAVYAASGTTVSVEGGTINRNECTAEYNGAGIYIDGATIRLSGNPYFGGSGVNDDGDIVIPATDPHAEGNWKQGAAPDGLTNGTAPYTQYRQDIFVHGMTGNPVANIVLAGNLGYATTGEFDQSSEGSIWTWVDDTTPTHHKDKEQFAVVANGAMVSEQSYSVFRNARDDAATDNSTGKYLSGVSGDAIEGVTCVYWGPSVKGARRVILRKVTTSDNATFGSLANATFTVYSGSSITKVDNVELKDLTSNTNGVFWIGDLPYGTYYLHETAPTDRWFTLTVGDDTEEGSYDGVVMSPAQATDPRERP